MNTARTTRRHPAAIRKAAILIATLDTPTADVLLDRMTDEQAARVRSAIMELDDLAPDEEETVIREFLEQEAARGETAADGVELDVELMRKIQSPGDYERRSAAEPPPPPRPFQAVAEVNVDAVARHLARQHPQTIALVVAHFPPPRAAAVIERLPARLQSDVLRRIADLDPTDPEVIREVEQELEQLLSRDMTPARPRGAGLSTVAAIVNAAGPSRQELLGRIERDNQDLALELAKVTGTASPPAVPTPARTGPLAASDSEERLAGPPAVTGAADQPVAQDPPADRSSARTFRRGTAKREGAPAAAEGVRLSPVAAAPVDFRELDQLADDEWALLIRAVEPQVVLLALAGADETFAARIARKLPGREARELQRRLEQIGPTQLADIDRAQQQMARRAAELAAEGRIRLPRLRSFAAAA